MCRGWGPSKGAVVRSSHCKSPVWEAGGGSPGGNSPEGNNPELCKTTAPGFGHQVCKQGQRPLARRTFVEEEIVGPNVTMSWTRRGPLGRDLFVVEAKETTRLLALTKDTKRRSVVDQVSLG